MNVIAPHLRAHLTAIGRWNVDGISRRATARHCPTCGLVILAGLDDDVAARPARTDPTPLSRLGEVAALILGRTTYQLRWLAGRYQLDSRETWTIRAHPAGTGPGDVLAEHVCGSALPAAPTQITPPTARVLPEHPDF